MEVYGRAVREDEGVLGEAVFLRKAHILNAALPNVLPLCWDVLVYELLLISDAGLGGHP